MGTQIWKDGRKPHEENGQNFSDNDEDINFNQDRRNTLIFSSRDEDDESFYLDEEMTNQYGSASCGVIKEQNSQHLIEKNLR